MANQLSFELGIAPVQVEKVKPKPKPEYPTRDNPADYEGFKYWLSPPDEVLPDEDGRPYWSEGGWAWVYTCPADLCVGYEEPDHEYWSSPFGTWKRALTAAEVRVKERYVKRTEMARLGLCGRKYD